MKTENYVSVCKLPCTIKHIYVGNINIHLQQKAFIEKCFVNKSVLQKAVIHCTAMFLERYLSRASILLDLQATL